MSLQGSFTPTYCERVASKLAGSPSFSRAHGARSASTVSRKLSPAKWTQRCRTTPVFHIEVSPNQPHALPAVWITEPAYDEMMNVSGREFIAVYPSGKDPVGEKALKYAEAYFGEALSYSESDQHELKAECFRAAEILFLHSAQRGCVEAYVKFGAIYADDLCAGSYCHHIEGSESERSLHLLRRSLECFSYAAAHGNAEACWRIADFGMSHDGFGLSPEYLIAMCERSLDLADAQNSTVDKGNAALRLAKMHEQGIGCEQSFRRAYAWYRIAEEELGFVVNCGGWYFKRARLAAERGVRRMRQELMGSY